MKIKIIKSVPIFTLTLLLSASVITAQTPREQTIANVFGNTWTDASQFFKTFSDSDYDSSRPVDNSIFFLGGDLHEGGIGFDVVINADGTMTVTRSNSAIGVGDRAEYRTVGGKSMLVFSDARTGAVKNAMRKQDRSLYDIYTDNFLKYVLAGNYRSKEGKKIGFPAADFCTEGLWDSKCTPYTFAEEYESPVLIIVHPGKDRAYGVKKNLTGLEFTPMKPDNEYENGWVKDGSKPRFSLYKIATSQPDFPLISDHVMTLSELRLHAGTPALQNLKIMRNEIFARYGYRFKTKDMADYFGIKAWYVPQYDDVTSMLTEIENINVALIQELEKRYEKWWDNDW